MKPLELCIERKEEFLLALKKYSTLQEAAIALGVSPSAIKSAALRLKVSTPPAANFREYQRKQTRKRAKTIIKMREQGLSYRDIGNRGFTVSQIRTVLLEAERFDLFTSSNLCSCGRSLRASKSIAEGLCAYCRESQQDAKPNPLD